MAGWSLQPSHCLILAAVLHGACFKTQKWAEGCVGVAAMDLFSLGTPEGCPAQQSMQPIRCCADTASSRLLPSNACT